jgi:hypothetical protein
MRIAAKLVLGAIAAVCVSAGNASATLIDYGDITLDTATGLEWLDVTKTTGMSYQDILNGAGGFYAAGWRSASWDQMNGLLATYRSAAPADRSLFGIFGITYFFYDHVLPELPHPHNYYTQGYFFGGDGGEGWASIVWRDWICTSCPSIPPGTIVKSDVWAEAEAAGGSGEESCMEGCWLVRETPVPEPTTLALMGFGALGIFIKTRRRQ